MSQGNSYDIVIVGGGPAGLTAGIYAARARYRTLLLEKIGLGGQLLSYEKVDNYPGFPDEIATFELVEKFKTQAERFGVTHINGDVEGLELNGPVKKVLLSDQTISAKSIVIASGCSRRKLGVPGEEEFTGRGVSFCAICDGPFYRNLEVAVVGGGDTAVEEAVYLTKFAKKVHLIHRRDQLSAIRILQEEAFNNPKIEFHWNKVVRQIAGSAQGVESVMLADTKTEETSVLEVAGIFVFIGLLPNTSFVPETLERDENGFLVTSEELETSVKGVFAAGDVRSKPLRQISTAVGDGATAASCAGRYLEALARSES